MVPTYNNSTVNQNEAKPREKKSVREKEKKRKREKERNINHSDYVMFTFIKIK